jgi:hypothetical protein
MFVSNDQLANCTVEAINAGLQSLKSSRSALGKVAVIVDSKYRGGEFTKDLFIHWIGNPFDLEDRQSIYLCLT